VQNNSASAVESIVTKATPSHANPRQDVPSKGCQFRRTTVGDKESINVSYGECKHWKPFAMPTDNSFFGCSTSVITLWFEPTAGSTSAIILSSKRAELLNRVCVMLRILHDRASIAATAATAALERRIKLKTVPFCH